MLFRRCSENIQQVPDGEVDLIITSPPYLNSRDYTDIYMLELKVLQLINSYEELRELRKNTLRSHVQVPYGKVLPIANERLKNSLLEMSNKELNTWNTDITNMICAYLRICNFYSRNLQRKCIEGVSYISM